MPDTHPFRSLPLRAMTQAPDLPQLQRWCMPQDPALSLLTDLRHAPCIVASHSDSLPDTLKLMQRARVRMVFVAGADGQLVGMVTAEDIQGERPVMRASSHHMSHRDLTLADVMIPVALWETVDLVQVRTARLGDIAATLHAHGLRYLLVTQNKDGRTVLRGLFSAHRLEMAMNMTIEADLHSRSFAELGQVLHH